MLQVTELDVILNGEFGPGSGAVDPVGPAGNVQNGGAPSVFFQEQLSLGDT